VHANSNDWHIVLTDGFVSSKPTHATPRAFDKIDPNPNNSYKAKKKFTGSYTEKNPQTGHLRAAGACKINANNSLIGQRQNYIL